MIVVAVGAYFLFGGDGGSSLLGGNSIPQPPALPSWLLITTIKNNLCYLGG